MHPLTFLTLRSLFVVALKMDHEHAKSIAIAINSIRVNVVSLNLLNTKTPYNVYIPKEVEFQLLQFEDAPPSYMQPNMYFALNLYYKL